MMTPQEAASSTFPKAAIGGYHMASVDLFLDKLTEDYTALYKENAALKAKIKVLVDKMEEYHAMEDTMRSTLLTAQKMANTMITEAEQKAAALVTDGESTAKRRVRELAAEVSAQEQRLEDVRREIDGKVELERQRLTVAQRELGAFIGAARKLCAKQMELIERLPELDILPDGFAFPEEPAAAQTVRAAPPDEKPAETAADAIAEPLAGKGAEKDAAPPPVEELAAGEAVDEEIAAAALAEVVEELGGDANTLMQNMRSVIDSFSLESGAETGEASKGDPFGTDFEDADSLFDETDREDSGEDSGEDNGDDFLDREDKKTTRILNLKDLQFGRNYTKDK